jgi:hypothetical protein
VGVQKKKEKNQCPREGMFSVSFAKARGVRWEGYDKKGDTWEWCRDVGQARFPRISVITRQFLAIPATSATAERCV